MNCSNFHSTHKIYGDVGKDSLYFALSLNDTDYRGHIRCWDIGLSVNYPLDIINININIPKKLPIPDSSKIDVVYFTLPASLPVIMSPLLFLVEFVLLSVTPSSVPATEEKGG